MTPTTPDFATLTAGQPDADDPAHADGPGALTVRIPPPWMQGRAAFGGLPAALGLAATRRLVEPDRTPRAMHAAFLAPIGPDPATATARVLRAGRALTQCEAEVRQGDTLCARITTAFGAPRASRITVAPPRRPALPSPDDCPPLPYLEGITPAFTRHFDYRFTAPNHPFSGAATPHLAGWIRHRTTPGPVHGAMLGLLDAWPAPVLVLAKRPIPASTVTWTVTFADVPETRDDASVPRDASAPYTPGDWWWFTSDAITAADGYSTLRGALYAPDGRLAALEEQLVAVFDG